MKKDEILNNMLDRLPEDYDKTEGGLFFDTLSPISLELEKLYRYLEYRFKNTFPETAEGEYLELLTKEVGISRKKATHSVGEVTIQGAAGTIIEKGTKVGSDTYIFETTEEKEITDESVKVPCKSVEKGSIYNIARGVINKFPITIPGLEGVTNEEAFTGGYDPEDDKSLLERYLIKVREPQTSGNIYDYKKWALDIEGVGNVKVFPLWNGNGTVKVSIIGNDNLPVNSELKERVQRYIDKNKPIGANVSVVSAEAMNINITVNVKINSIQTQEQAREAIKNSIEEYIKKIAFKQDEISLAKIGYHILKIDSVVDYKNLNVNGGTQNNINIPEASIAVLNEFTVNFYKD